MNKENNFEWYNPEMGCPKISIASYGITLNKSTVLIMNNPRCVKLGYDKEKNLLCIKICDEKDKDKILIKDTNDNKYKRINSKDFISLLNMNMCNKFGDKVMKYTGSWDSTEKELIVDLNDYAKNIKDEENHEENEGQNEDE